ncbi:DNA-binding protein [Azospirillum argentinense]|uniref:DNA-binding protein n=2 Tax=Azospirillum TaxID=191 RepID=A0A060DJ98_9PROT|nr:MULTISPECIES: helix-turn-helix domain-containing protein [Azospirillum]AIB12967.1 DNA-binding protein [Azospirillum argentinense]EZQ07210.1 DNA-binding protein [Azospirillum argentinense]KAA1055427.1 Transcriptional regulator, Xre family [Azospirillum argentinense]MBK3800911.1 ImmA/IrrE family metallo-endopeptidase [Azospirillum argentinense]NUB08948.1 ImmA/IrrE family metallo-endopeptidase [Azospirillum baldaniorum]
MDKKAMLGPKVRRLRRDHGLTQAQMAEQLGISPSYLNLIEHNQRPVTVPLLLKLGQNFGVDLQSFAEDEESRLVAGLREVFADPLFDGSDIKNQDFRELAAVAPTLGQAVVALYRAFRTSRDDLQTLSERVADREKLHLVQTSSFPQDEVRDLFQAHSNHFAELEAAAEELWQEGRLEKGDLYRGLTDYLLNNHSVRVRLLPSDIMGYAVRRFDRHGRRILLSEMLAPSGRNFQLACQIALLRHRDLLNQIVESSGLTGDEARRLARIGLANYFAAAVVMPYARFWEAANQVRYDIEILRRRFDASFEQVCQRLTTLQRPGAKGVPFFLMRVDSAGNVSKRFSGAGFHLARFGGGCARWIVYEAFRTPGKIHSQLAQMPDGTTYFSIARTVVKAGGGFRSPPQQFAIALGCDLQHAAQITYADGVDLENTEAATPIGVNCRLCPRLDCSQRAFPPLNHRLIVDENLRGLSPYLFAPPAGE